MSTKRGETPVAARHTDRPDSSTTQVERPVDRAHTAEGEQARPADRIARPLVPNLLVMAALFAPIGLVTMVSLVCSVSGLGVVINSGAAFEQLGTICHLNKQSPTALTVDGINDGPALASAAVGIAMGVTGTAAEVEPADVTFSGTELR